MRTELESQDIERIADKVIEKLLPIIQVRQPEKFPVADERLIAKKILSQRKENRCNKSERKPRMLTVRESAGYLGIAEKTLRNRLGLRTANPFPVKPKHIGGKVLFDVKDLDSYLDKLPTT